MKFRQRKKNFLNKYGRNAMVYCNRNTKFRPVAEFLDEITGSPNWVRLDNHPKSIPQIGERWIITYTRSGMLRAIKPAPPLRMSEYKIKKIYLEIDRLMAGINI
jgi:hypothetical protein